MRRQFGSRYQRSSRSPITTKTVYPKRPGRCAACKQPIAPGSEAVQVRLMKRYRMACSGCGTVPVGKKKYHVGCVPTDLNAAMKFDPTKMPGANPMLPYGAAPTSRVAPPPKPPTFEDLGLAALLALEKALAFKKVPANKVKEVEDALEQYKKIKARALRPGSPAEGEVATGIAIQKLVKLIFTA